MTKQTAIPANHILDCKGLACPMPIVKTKKRIETMLPGEVLEVQATDKGSLADMQGWAKNTGHAYLGTIHDGDVLKHYLRKASPQETKTETKFPHTITSEELEQKLSANQAGTVLDVREPAEYAFNRIPGAKSIPFGELEKRWNELKPDDEIHVVCRSGNRSDLACQVLADKGFTRVKNVLPGMNGWKGPVESNE